MIYLQDPDVTLWHGDVLDTLRAMPDGSVDCVITSPPYWGLRDYGTGLWEGGDPDCDHRRGRDNNAPMMAHRNETERLFRSDRYLNQGDAPFDDVCGKCGATRQDQQLGLEPTPDLFVARMVEVFREVRRVLAAHGTCWVNLGDSYATGTATPSQPSADVDNGYWQNADKLGRNRIDGRQAGLKPKDLVGIPWRVAFALQADGWYLRSDIVWSKPNPMPESVTDRTTKAHEYVFLLTKQPRYFYDGEAIREPHTAGNVQRQLTPDRKAQGDNGARGSFYGIGGARYLNPAGRNARSVWEIATQPYPEAHFATYPEELVRRCLLAGCPEWVCRVCGKPRERIVERESYITRPTVGRDTQKQKVNPATSMGLGRVGGHVAVDTQTLGWSDCGHNNYRPGVVLDPFVGSGTTCHVARKHGRHAIGIDLNANYLALAARRLQQQSLFADVAP